VARADPPGAEGRESGAGSRSRRRPRHPPAPGSGPRLFFYPAWETLPHESRLPHADVISERLETLIALSDNSQLTTPINREQAHNSQLVVTTVTALLQRTFAPAELRSRTLTLAAAPGSIRSP